MHLFDSPSKCSLFFFITALRLYGKSRDIWSKSLSQFVASHSFNQHCNTSRCFFMSGIIIKLFQLNPLFFHMDHCYGFVTECLSKNRKVLNSIPWWDPRPLRYVNMLHWANNVIHWSFLFIHSVIDANFIGSFVLVSQERQEPSLIIVY